MGKLKLEGIGADEFNERNKPKSLNDLAHKYAVEKKIERKIINTFPVRPEWQHFVDDLKRLKVELKSIARRKEILEESLWLQVETDLQDVDSSFRLDIPTNSIQVYEPESEEIEQKIKEGKLVRHGDHYHDTDGLLDDLSEHLDLGT